MNQRGNTTRPRMATATVMTTASAAMPRNALGNPNSDACQLCATMLQLITELRSQPSDAVGSSASVRASIESTNDASRPIAPEMTISIAVRVRHACDGGSSRSGSGSTSS